MLNIENKNKIEEESKPINIKIEVLNKSNTISFIKILSDIKCCLTRISEPMNLFFVRYFVVHSLKEQLEKIDISISGPFLGENLREMNKMHKSIIKQDPENKMNESFITILIQENIQLLVSLTCMKSDLFANEVFPNLIDLVYDTTDNSYQQYSLDWIISGLSEELTLMNLNKILSTMQCLYPDIELEIPQKMKRILDRILAFLRINSTQKDYLIKNTQSNFNEIYDYISKVITNARKQKISINLFLEFIDTIMSFIRCCSIKSEQGKFANGILAIFSGYLSDINDKKTIDHGNIKKYHTIINALIKESNVTVFDIDYTRIIAKQFDSKTTIDNYFHLLEWILKYQNIIDSTAKVSIINDIIKEVFDDHNSQFHSRKWSMINSIMDMIHNKEPAETAQCYIMLIGSISHYDWDGSRTLIQGQDQGQSGQSTQGLTRNPTIISMPVVVEEEEDSLTHFFTCLLNLIHICEIRFLIKENLITETEKDKDPTTGLDLPQIDIDKLTEEDFLILVSFFYTAFKNDIKKYAGYPKISLKAILKALKQIDGHKVGRNGMMYDNFLELYDVFFQILLKETLFSNTKVEFMIQLIEVIKDATILPKQQYLKIIFNIGKISKSLQKRGHTIQVSLATCDLYYNNNHVDIIKIKELIEEADKEGKFAIAKIENLPLYLLILKTLLKFMDKTNQRIVSLDTIHLIIQTINDNIADLKASNKKLGMEVEKMFKEAKDHIKKMNDDGIEYYEGIDCDVKRVNDDFEVIPSTSSKSAKLSNK